MCQDTQKHKDNRSVHVLRWHLIISPRTTFTRIDTHTQTKIWCLCVSINLLKQSSIREKCVAWPSEGFHFLCQCGHLVDFGLKPLVRDLKCEMNAELI